MSKDKIFIIFLIVGMVVYGNVLGNNFVDDDEQLSINTAFHSIKSIPTFFTSGDGGSIGGGYYRPVSDTFLTLEYRVFGMNPLGYHTIQIFLHVLITYLVYEIFLKYFSKELAFFMGMIFMVHPLNTESVAYISAIRENLYLLFGLMAVNMCWWKTKPSTKYTGIALMTLMSLLAKETGGIFILIVTLVSWFNNRKQILVTAGTQFLTFLFYMILREISGISFSKTATVPIMSLNTLERMKNIPALLSYYMGNAIFPNHLFSNQSWVVKNINMSNFYLPLLFFGLLVFLILVFYLYLRKSNNVLLNTYGIFVFWLIISMGVHLQIVPLDLTAADRWFYAAMVGYLGVWGVIISQIKKFPRAIWLGVIILMVIRTEMRIPNWKNSLTLASHDMAIQKKPDYLLSKRYGTELMKNNNLDEAEIYLTKANNLFPQNFGAWNNLGVIYYYKGEPERALKAFEAAIVNNNYYGAYENISFILIKSGKPNLAYSYVKEGLKLYPNDISLLKYAVWVNLLMGNRSDALVAANNYYMKNPTVESRQLLEDLSQGRDIQIN